MHSIVKKLLTVQDGKSDGDKRARRQARRIEKLRRDDKKEEERERNRYDTLIFLRYLKLIKQRKNVRYSFSAY